MIVTNHSHGHTLYITGEGKSGIVGERMASSLTSIGISSQFVPSVEWSHGELGHLRKGDYVLLISHSGKNEDVVKLINVFKKRGIITIGMCGDEKSSLLNETDAVLNVYSILCIGIICTFWRRVIEVYSNSQCDFTSSSSNDI